MASEFHTDEIATAYIYKEVDRINEVGVEVVKELTASGARQGEYQILNMDTLLERYNQITELWPVLSELLQEFPSCWW